MKIGKIHGEGTWTSDGDRFDGAFENGKMVDGQGTWTLANGHDYRFSRALKNAQHLLRFAEW
jgi:hypothetical protein